MNPPFIVVDRDGWLNVFETLSALKNAIEAIEVEDDEYKAWDSAGQSVRLRVVGELGARSLMRSARVEASEGTFDQETFRATLLAAVPTDAPALEMSDEALVASVVARRRNGLIRLRDSA